MALLKPKRIFQNISYPARLQISRSNKTSDIPVLPNQKFSQKIPSHGSIPQSLTAFHTSAQCVIALSAFDWFNIWPQFALATSMDKIGTKTSISKLPKKLLHSIIVNNVRHPPCIVSAALQYVEEVLKNHIYVGLHWRYDKQDWLRSCPGKTAAQSKFICKNIDNITPQLVAKVVFAAVKSRYKDVGGKTSLPIYIAAPPDAKVFVNNVYEELENLNKSFTRPFMSLEMFLRNKHETCWQKNKWTNVPNLISQTEIEIMKNSFCFFYSERSTWSGTVRRFRIVSENDDDREKRFEESVIKLIGRSMNESAG